ncbi:MAG: site-specific integrase, partial [bacterium]
MQHNLGKNFNEYVKEFLEYLKVTKNYSLHTITSYEIDLLQFEKYICKSLFNDSSGVKGKQFDFGIIDLA